MKILAIFFLLFALFCGPFIYDGWGAPTRCEIEYDTSFNGLWLIKSQQCYGKLGLPRDEVEIARKPLFRAF